MILGPCIDIFVGGSNDRQCSQKTQHRRQCKHDLRGKSARQQDEHLTPLLYTFICQPFSFKQVPNFECDFIYIYKISSSFVLSSLMINMRLLSCYSLPSPPEYCPPTSTTLKTPKVQLRQVAPHRTRCMNSFLNETFLVQQ